MITSIEDLYGSLQSLISTATGVGTVILADQGRPAPEGLYATYNPVPIRAVGHPRQSRELVAAEEDFNESLLGADWEDYDATTISQMELTLSVNFFNEGARDAAWKMHNAMHRWPVQERLYTAGIAWRGNSEVRRLTEVIQAGLQPRYQVDANLWIEVAITEQVLRANSFYMQVEDKAGNVLYDGS